MSRIRNRISSALIVFGVVLVLGAAGLSDTNSCSTAECCIRCAIGLMMAGGGFLLK